MHSLLRNYINKLTVNDIRLFANSRGITLNNTEIELIYKYVKNDWETIIFGNSTKIFDDLKENLTPCNYQIIVNLFDNYKEKFKNYL